MSSVRAVLRGKSFIKAGHSVAFEDAGCRERDLNGPSVPKSLIWKHKTFRSQKWHLETNLPLYSLVIALGYESFSKEHSKIREEFIIREKNKIHHEWNDKKMFLKTSPLCSWACFMVTFFSISAKCKYIDWKKVQREKYLWLCWFMESDIAKRMAGQWCSGSRKNPPGAGTSRRVLRNPWAVHFSLLT